MSENVLNLLLVLGTWAGIFAALYAVWLQSKNERELMSVQLFLQLAQQYDSEDMQRKRYTLAAELLKNPNDLEIDDTVLTFFENVAHLHRRHLIEDEMTWNFFSVDVIFFHSAAAHYIQVVRQKFKAPDLFQEFEILSKAWQGKRYSTLAVNDTTRMEFLRWTSRISKTQ